MIELLGVGVQGRAGQWLLHQVCARVERGLLTAVVTGTPAQSAAFIDAASGRVIPCEGRVWVGRRPLMRETAGRIRAAVAEVARTTPYGLNRSALWNTLIAPDNPLAGLLRFPRRSEREAALRALDAVGLAGRAREPMSALTAAERMRVGLARALFRKPAVVVLRELDAALGPDETASLLRLGRKVARAERIVVVASLAAGALARVHADRVIVLAEGRALELADGPVSRRLEAARP